MLYINIKDLGAIGDGVKDDYNVIQNAVNKAYTEQKVVYIPSGTYFISKTILLKNRVQIVGDGPYLSKIKMKNTLDIGIKCKLDSDVTQGISIRDIQVEGSQSSKSIKQTAIYLENYHYLSDVENVRISNVNKGIYITNSWYAQIKDISLMGIDEYGIEIYQKSMRQQVNALPLINIQQDGGNTAIYAHAADGVNGRGLYISNSTFENTNKTAVILEHIGNVSIKDCYFENNYLDTTDRLRWDTPTDIKIVNDKWAAQFSANNITIGQQGKFPSDETCNIYIGEETVASLSNIDVSYYGGAIRDFKCALYSDTIYPIFTQSVHMTDGLELIKKKAFTLAGSDVENTMDISMSCGNLLKNSNFRFGTGFWSVDSEWNYNVEKSNDHILAMSINEEGLTEHNWATISQKFMNPGSSGFMQCGVDVFTDDKTKFKGENVVIDISGYREDGTKEYVYSTYITPDIENEWISNHIVFNVEEYIKKIKYSIILNQNGSLKIRKPYVNLGYVRPIYSCDINASKSIPQNKSDIIVGEICLSDDLEKNKPIGWVYCNDNRWRAFGNIL
ncbi:MAG: glycosyl hydrolase family 28-related protein [Romboutsia sp.]